MAKANKANKKSVKTASKNAKSGGLSAKELIALMKDSEFQFVDFRFTDPRGKLHHMTLHIDAVTPTELDEGVLFDGSSIAGWRAINESDMLLLPDLESAQPDPFSQFPTMTLFCNVLDPKTNKPYNRDPRSIALAAEAYAKKSGVADTIYFGPEVEFFIFDDVRFKTDKCAASYAFDSVELPHNSDRIFQDVNNLGHRPTAKGGYVPVAPVDSLNDLRAEMLNVLGELGVPVEKHHHEVAPAQCELGIKYQPLVLAADAIQTYKYVVHNVANAYQKTATFMPKPMFGDNGSGMHCHQSLFKGGKPLFAGNKYAGLSDTALYYIGGIIKHARALNAFTNPSTNSYKRLVPGYEAPVLLAYSASNRSASCRIPHASHEKGKRVEVRFPDPAANPYLAFAAMLLAGLDGIDKKITPGKAMDMNLYELPEAELKKVPHVCRSLREALEALESDHAFLLKGGVFTEDQIESYIALKMDEVLAYETRPHPVEFEMYYSV